MTGKRLTTNVSEELNEIILREARKRGTKPAQLIREALIEKYQPSMLNANE